MSKFYGTVRGRADTLATRCGTESSGITTSAQSWEGSVIVRLASTGTDDDDNMSVQISLSDSSDNWCGDLYFYGSFEELKQALESYTTSVQGSRVYKQYTR